MTSKQVMLTLAAMLLIGSGCQLPIKGRTDRLDSPYSDRQVWAVVPLRNESGSLQADGVIMADHLTRQLENVQGVDALPVNRVLAAMEAQKMPAVTSVAEALQLMRTLGVDGLVVGTITAYDPYDPPKLGITVELYVEPATQPTGEIIDVRRISRAATDELSLPEPSGQQKAQQPVNVVSGFFDASDPNVRANLEAYGKKRGPVEDDRIGWHRYRISMDLYMEFVGFTVSEQLMQAESLRLIQPETVDSAP